MHLNVPINQLTFFDTAIKSLDFLLKNKTFQNIFGKIKFETKTCSKFFIANDI
jgi:hypothetical protein